MTSKCYLSPAAEQDIDEVITYLAKENPTAAHSFLDALYDAMEKLSDHPEVKSNPIINYKTKKKWN